MTGFGPTSLDGVIEIVPQRFSDARGFVSETWSRKRFAGAGIDIDFVQDNHSYSEGRGVLRGLHYQLPPFAQDKLVRVVRGRIYDVAVDIRRGSPAFGRWVAVELSAERGNQLLVPKGFAHGFVTLEPGCEVVYKVSGFYSKPHERCIRFDDPAIGIDWPDGAGALQLSERDRQAPLLAGAEVFE